MGRQFFIITLLLLTSFSVPAQEEMQVRTGMITGIVTDAALKEGVEFASVAVFNVKDSSLAGGALTDEKGRFTVTGLKPGRYSLRISFIGYETHETKSFQLTSDRNIYDAGSISITASGQTLNEVSITAEKSDFQNAIDRKIYNVDKNIVNAGGTATEVLQNIPSVTVDGDGNVELRGSSSVTVFIDGKPSTITGGSRQAILQQIPASAIEQIEVVTNPSAKYDAEGMAGIINIKTKKGKLKGLNGNASVSAGTNNKYNASAGLNNRSAKFNVYGNYSFRSEERRMEGNSFQQYLNSPVFNTIETHSGGEETNKIHTGKAGIDFHINNQNTLGASATYTVRSEIDPEITTSHIDYAIAPDTISFRNIQADENHKTYEAALDYKKTFKNNKSELTASALYSLSDRIELNDYYSTPVINNAYQINHSDAEITNITFQSDYSHPFASTKLETGIKGTRRINDENVNAFLMHEGSYINDIRYTDHFIFTEDVLAAYGLFSGKFKSFDYSAGLRAEQTLTDGDSKTTESDVKRDYFALFPSAVLRHSLGKNADISATYSRRTNRPRMWSLNPFTDYSDTLNIRKGNPNLLPEYINSFELGLNKTVESITASATVYYRHIDDVISRYRFTDAVTGISTYTSVNFSTADNIGLEGIMRFRLKNGSIMWSFNVFRNTINGKNIDPEMAGTNTNWNTRLTGNMKLSKSLSMQITGMYMAPNRQPQRVIRSMMSGVDAGIKYEFWKGKGSLSLNVTDIFNTREFDIHMEQENAITDSIRKRETRIGTITFAYLFGAQDNPFINRKKTQRQQQDGGDEMDF